MGSITLPERLRGIPKQTAVLFQFHSSSPVSGSLTIPERLRGIPEAEDPGFFEMVEYFFHKAEISCEPVVAYQ
jgi:hypothetical protein